MLCFVVVMQSFIMNSHEVFIHIHQGCFAGTGAIFRLPQCQWSKPDGYGKISQCITTTKHSKAKTVSIFLGIYCIMRTPWRFPHYWPFLKGIRRWPVGFLYKGLEMQGFDIYFDVGPNKLRKYYKQSNVFCSEYTRTIYVIYIIHITV